MTTPLQVSLDSFKLSTIFTASGVVHSHPGKADEVWRNISLLGHGGEGTVYLQELQSSPARLCAVKEISHDLRRASPGHVIRELNMMMAVHDVGSPLKAGVGRADTETARASVRAAVQMVPESPRKAVIGDAVFSTWVSRNVYQVNFDREAGCTGDIQAAPYWSICPA